MYHIGMGTFQELIFDSHVKCQNVDICYM